jgi:hypothetical protein
MLDILYLSLTAGFFGVMLAYSGEPKPLLTEPGVSYRFKAE